MATLKGYKLNELISIYELTHVEIPFPLKVIDMAVIDPDDTEYTAIGNKIQALFDSNAVRDYLFRRYGDFTFYTYNANTYSAWEDFARDWGIIVKSQSLQLVTLMKALLSQYNPLENYDLYEDSAVGSSSSGMSTENKAVGTTTTNKDTTYDNSALTEVASSTVKYDVGNDGIVSSTVSEVKKDVATPFTDMTGSVHKGDSNSYTSINKLANHKHGNAGVMTVPDMINKEFDIRVRNAILEFVDSYAKGLLVLVELGDD